MKQKKMNYLTAIVSFALLFSSLCMTSVAHKNANQTAIYPDLNGQIKGHSDAGPQKSKNNQLTKREKKEGWVLLFDGKQPDQWRGINKDSFPSKGWKVENGELVVYAEDGAESGNGGDIITKKQYSSFILEWEWLMETKGGNSGIKYLVQEGIGSNDNYGYGLEYQILDDANFSKILTGEMKLNDNRTMGSLYYIYPASPSKKPNPLGTWNKSRIVCNGNHVEHWLNGLKILEYERGSDDFKNKIQESKFKNVPGYGLWPQGHLLIQDHGSVVHFRNMKIKELK
jgi:hypothetical protein